jgi:hypothetical protein
MASPTTTHLPATLPAAAPRPARPTRHLRIATPWARTLAVFVDATLFLIAAPLTIGVPGLLLGDFWPIGSALIAVLCAALAWSEGGSPGMRLFHLRLIEPRSGRPATYSRAFVRSALVVPQAVAGLVLLNATIAALAGATPASATVLALSGLVIVFAAAEQCRMAYDPRGQALHDHLSGLVMVRIPRS